MATKQKLTPKEKSIKQRDKLAQKEVGINLARRVLQVVDKGLCDGVGEPIPGHMCVEAAVCYAMGEPHSDEPSCVGQAPRLVKISLNDMFWSSKKARAKGLRRVAIAQLGSTHIDDHDFCEKLARNLMVDILVPESKRLLNDSDLSRDAKRAMLKVLKEMKNPNRPITSWFSLWLRLYNDHHVNIDDSSTVVLARMVEVKSVSPAEIIDSMSYWLDEKDNTIKRMDERLTRIANAIEKTLKQCGSQGTKWLSLCSK